MKEYKQDESGTSQVSVYWLAFKTQLIRCAPHHVRADVKSLDHALDDTPGALNTVRQLRSRGVTRFYDLNRANRQNLADVEDDEHGEASGLESLSEHEMAPPRQRPRLSISMPDPDTSQESPEPPPDLAPAPSVQHEAPPAQDPSAAHEPAEPQELHQSQTHRCHKDNCQLCRCLLAACHS